MSMLSGTDIVVDEVHSPEDERTHTDEAKVKPCSSPKRGKLGKTRRRGWLSEVCVPGRRLVHRNFHRKILLNPLRNLSVLRSASQQFNQSRPRLRNLVFIRPINTTITTCNATKKVAMYYLIKTAIILGHLEDR